MATWKDKFSFLTPNYIVHEVGGEKLHFFPVSVGAAFELRKIGKPLAKAIATLMAGRGNDYGSIQRKFDSGSEFIMEAVGPDIAKVRHDQQTRAIEELIDSIMADENVEVIGKILMDSLKDLWVDDPKGKPPAKEFIQSLPLPILVEMIFGVCKANKEVFGPLESLFSQWSAAMTKKLMEKVNPQTNAAAEVQIEANGRKPNDEESLPPLTESKAETTLSMMGG